MILEKTTVPYKDRWSYRS